MRGFNASARSHTAEPERAQAPSWRCAAHGCQLPGVILTGGDPVCGFHHGASVGDWPRVTEAMNSTHGPLLSELLTARRYFGRVPQSRESSDRERLAEAWSRLRPHGYDLDPASCVRRPGGERVPAAGYRVWMCCVEAELSRLVSGNKPAPTRPTNHRPAANSGVTAVNAAVALSTLNHLPRQDDHGFDNDTDDRPYAFDDAGMDAARP